MPTLPQCQQQDFPAGLVSLPPRATVSWCCVPAMRETSHRGSVGAGGPGDPALGWTRCQTPADAAAAPAAGPAVGCCSRLSSLVSSSAATGNQGFSARRGALPAGPCLPQVLPAGLGGPVPPWPHHLHRVCGYSWRRGCAARGRTSPSCAPWGVKQCKGICTPGREALGSTSFPADSGADSGSMRIPRTALGPLPLRA